jgi:hypothetical protein
MNMPGFDAESSLGSTKGIYRSHVVFGGSGTGEILPMQEFVASSTLSRNLLVPPGSTGKSQSTPSLPPETCIDILYVPVCHQINHFTECCTRSHEVRCPVGSSCTKGEVFSCTECHSTISGFPTDGVLQS